MSKIIGLDLGTTTLGVAITDETRQFVFARAVIRFQPHFYLSARKQLIQLLELENVDTIVLGLPYNMDGSLGVRGESVKRFASDLQNEMPNLTIIFQDERLSSVEAHERLSKLGYNSKKQKTKVDMVAAQVILETYLQRK